MKQKAPSTPPVEEKIEKEEKNDFAQELENLQKSLVAAQEDSRRAMADYQNLMRRTQEERLRMIKLAGLSVVESLVGPFEHLYLAKAQLKDPGLDMVYQQFQQALQNEGLIVIDPLGEEFDSHTMEVVHKEPTDDEKQVGKVVKVVKRGYKLNGEVIEHAKVVVGEIKK